MEPLSSKETSLLHRRLLFDARPVFAWLGAGAGITALSTLVLVGQMVLLARIIDAVVFGGAGLDGLYLELGLLAAAIALRSLLGRAGESVAQRGAIAMKLAIRHRLVTKLFALGPAYTGGERTGELVTSAIDGVEKLDAYYARFLPQALAMGIVPAIVLVTVLFLDPLSGLVLLFTGPLIPIFMWLIGTHAERKTRDQWRSLQTMSAHFLDTLQGLTTLKLFGRSTGQDARIGHVTEVFRTKTMAVLKIAFLSSMVLELAAALSTAIVAVEVGIRLIEGLLLFSTGLLVLLLTPEFYLPFRRFGVQHHAGMEATAAAARIFEILDHPDAASGEDVVLLDDAPTITFDGLTFAYPGQENLVLDDITLTLAPGTVTAIVGPSGAGKSTIARHLMRFAEADEGAIRINGVDLQRIAPGPWRRNVAYVPQNPHLFDGTLRDNLLLARPNAEEDAPTEDSLRRAVADAGLEDFVAALPDGLDTPLGEAAGRLSGGEAQRVAIARAFLRDAPVLILDEPSAHLDPDREAALVKSLERLTSSRQSRGRTTLIIAHRLATVAGADQVVVLDAGRVVSIGGPELLDDLTSIFDEEAA